MELEISLSSQMDFINNQTGWMAGDDFFRTQNGGTSWQEITTGFDWGNYHEIEIVNNTNGISVGEFGSVISTTDGGTNWTNIVGVTYADLNATSFIGVQDGWIVGDDGIILKAHQASTAPDLTVENVRVSDTTLIPNQEFSIGATVRNQGNRTSNNATLLYYVLPAPGISDGLEGIDLVLSLDPNNESQETRTLSAYQDTYLANGNYQVHVCVSPVNGEINTANNCSANISINIDPSNNENEMCFPIKSKNGNVSIICL